METHAVSSKSAGKGGKAAYSQVLASGPKLAWADEMDQDSSSQDELADIWQRVMTVPLESSFQKIAVDKKKRVFKVPASIYVGQTSPFQEGHDLCKVIAKFFGNPIEYRTDIPMDWQFVTDDLRERTRQVTKFLLGLANSKWREVNTGVFARKYDQIGLAILVRWCMPDVFKQHITVERELQEWFAKNLTSPAQSWWAGVPGHLVNALEHWFKKEKTATEFICQFQTRKLPPLGKKSLGDMNVQFFEKKILEQDSLLVLELQRELTFVSQSMLASNAILRTCTAGISEKDFSPDAYASHLENLARGGNNIDLATIAWMHLAFKRLGRDKNGAYIRRMRHWREGGSAASLPAGLQDDAVSKIVSGTYRELARQLGPLPSDERKRKRSRSALAPEPPKGLHSESTQNEVASAILSKMKASGSLQPGEEISSGAIIAYLSNGQYTQIKTKQGKLLDPPKEVKSIRAWYLANRRAVPVVRRGTTQPILKAALSGNA